MNSVIVPAFNEEKGITHTLETLSRVREAGEIVVVDDGSRDKTLERAREFAKKHKNVTVIASPENKGKGAAMRLGAEKARGDTLIFIDASQFDASQIPLLLREAKVADMIVGVRPWNTIPWQRRITNALTKLAILLGTGKRVEDALSGFRVIKKKDFLRLDTKQDRYAIEAEINFLAFKHRLRVKGVPVKVFYDEMPGMRVGGSKTSLSSFLKHRFLIEARFNVRMVLKLWFRQ